MTKKKKILFLTRSLEIGGLERVVVLLANNLDRERFEPVVCCTATAGKMSEALKDDCRLYVIGNTGRINLQSYRYLHRLIREQSIDLIHSHEFSALLYGLPVARLSRIPIVYTKHGYKPGQERRSIELIGRWFSRSVSEYVCVSLELKEKIRKELGLREEKLSVIYNGIETFPEQKKTDREKKGEVIIGSVGRLNEAKNYALLIDAFSDIHDLHPDCRLEIVGGGELEDELKALTAKLGLTDCVSLHGFRLNVSDFLDRFDIFTLTSIREGHSISLLEALGKRKISVVSDAGGNTEIVEDGVNGFVFASENKDELISKMSTAIKGLDSDEFDQMRDNALDTVKSEFSMDAMIKKHEELYDKHIESVSGGSILER